MDAQQRRDFFRTDQGRHMATEIGNISQLNDALIAEEQGQPPTGLASSKLLDAIKISAQSSIQSIGGISRANQSGAMSVISDGATATTDPLGSQFGGDLARDFAGGIVGESAETVNDPDYFGVEHKVYSKEPLLDKDGKQVRTEGKVAKLGGKVVKAGGKVVKVGGKRIIISRPTGKVATQPIVGPGLTKEGQKVFFTKPVRRNSSGGKIPSPKVEFAPYLFRKYGELAPIGSKVVGDKTATVMTAQERRREEERVSAPP